jgi:hypothetical protein
VAVMLAQLAHAQCHIRLEENNRQGQERRDDAADDGNKIKEESQQPKERGKIDLAYGEDDPSAKARPCERAREREKETHAVFCRSMFLMVSISRACLGKSSRLMTKVKRERFVSFSFSLRTPADSPNL